MKKSELKELIKDELGKGAEKSKEDTNFLEDDPAAMEMLQDYEEKDTVQQADRIVEQWQTLKEIAIEPEESNQSTARIDRFIQSQEAKNILSGQIYPNVVLPEDILREFKSYMLDEDSSDEYTSNPAAVLKAIVSAYDNAVENFYDDLSDKVNEFEEFIEDFLNR